MTYVVRQRGPRELRLRVVKRADDGKFYIALESWRHSIGRRPSKTSVQFLTSNEAERLVKALTAARVDLITARERKRHVEASA